MGPLVRRRHEKVMKIYLKQLTGEEMLLFMDKLGQKPYRAGQLSQWLYKKMARSFDEMSDLPVTFREELSKASLVSSVSIVREQTSADGTRKFLFQLQDGETIESVLIPNSRGKDSFTLCISSQAGCAVGCAFCMTGRLGLKRNLQAHEIIDQVVAVERLVEEKPGASITNIVFMGMGEPLHNFTQVRRALLRFTGIMGFSRRRITVSTSGIVPGIQRLAKEGPVVNLAISLNATTDEIRNTLMPVNRKYPLKKLLEACRDFPLAPNRRITFEYVMLNGVNDSDEDAHRLAKLLKGIKSKVNLIPFNPTANASQFSPPPESRITEFQDILRKSPLTVLIRKSMGADISAACGQLSGTTR